jgi:hypothetical protein
MDFIYSAHHSSGQVDYAGSMRERSRVISELRDAKTVLCNRFKERVNNVSRTAQGLHAHGLHFTFHLSKDANANQTTQCSYLKD